MREAEGGTETRAPDLNRSLPRSARLRSRFHISPQLQNSCLHFSEPGSFPEPRSVGAWLRLDSLGLLPASTFQSRQPFSPRTAARPGRMQKLRTESPAGISPASHSCARLGKRVALAAAAAAEPAPGPARAPTAESLGRCHPPHHLDSPTVPRRSPLPGRRAA